MNGTTGNKFRAFVLVALLFGLSGCAIKTARNNARRPFLPAPKEVKVSKEDAAKMIKFMPLTSMKLQKEYKRRGAIIDAHNLEAFRVNVEKLKQLGYSDAEAFAAVKAMIKPGAYERIKEKLGVKKVKKEAKNVVGS